MWKIMKAVGIFVFLILCSLQDIREKRLPVKMLVLSGGLFFLVSLVSGELFKEGRLLALMPGMVALVLAFLTREQIGYGDGVCLVVLGLLVSAERLIGAIAGGLFLISACSILLLVRKKANRKTTLPFMPFLTVGMLWQLIMWRGEGL